MSKQASFGICSLFIRDDSVAALSFSLPPLRAPHHLLDRTWMFPVPIEKSLGYDFLNEDSQQASIEILAFFDIIYFTI